MKNTEFSMRKYEAGDLLQMQQSVLEGFDNERLALIADTFSEVGAAVTFLDSEGRVAMCCGATPHMFIHEVGDLWAIPSDDAPSAFFGRDIIKLALKYLFENGKYRRLQFSCPTDKDFAVRLDEKFGFNREALMRRYGPNGEDHFLFALLRKDFEKEDT